MTVVNLRSLDLGWCPRCTGTPVVLPDARIIRVEFDDAGPCSDPPSAVHGDPASYTGPRDDVIATLQALGFIVA